MKLCIFPLSLQLPFFFFAKHKQNKRRQAAKQQLFTCTFSTRKNVDNCKIDLSVTLKAAATNAAENFKRPKIAQQMCALDRARARACACACALGRIEHGNNLACF